MYKITLMIGHLWQGGGERVCVNLANEFVKLGYKVEVVVFSLEKAIFDKDLNDNITLTCLNIDTNKSAIWKLFFYLNRTKPTYIVSFNYHISFFLVLLKSFFKFKLFSRSISTFSENFKNRTSIFDKIKIKLLTYGLKKSDLVISQSEGMKKDLNKFNIKKIEVINNPINPKYLNIQEDKKEDFILFVGRLSKEKRIDDLLKAFCNVNENYSLYIIGNGILKDELKNLATKLQIMNRVKFLGHKSNIEEYYTKARCTLLSSLYEGFPNVLVESIACGTPVVSYNCPNGPSEIIIDGVNGYLVDYLDIEDLYKKINKTLDEELDINLIKKSAERYYPEKIAKKYIEVIFEK